MNGFVSACPCFFYAKQGIRNSHGDYRLKIAHRCLVNTHDLVHVLVDRQQQRIPLCKLIAVLRLGSEHRPLVLRQPLLEVGDLRTERRNLRFRRLQRRLHAVELLGERDAGAEAAAAAAAERERGRGRGAVSRRVVSGGIP